jgi:hypothetical protein
MLRKGCLLLTTVSLLGACAHAKIPRTDIDDTEENRAILEIVEEYKRAVEALDTDAVLALVSPRFYEDNGNTDADDDYDFDGLRQGLAEDFKRTKALQLDVRVDAIEVEEDGAAFAELYYQIRAQNEYPSGLKWETNSDRTRLRFERADGKWLIVAGL